MKTSRRLLLSIIGILSISSCGSAPKETYDYRQIEYTLKEGHSINELEGQEIGRKDKYHEYKGII